MTAQPWETERLSINQAKELISKQFPNLKINSISLLGEGWDNTSYIINNEIVFRFPRKEFSVSLLINEINLLPIIANKLPLPVPVPEHIGSPSSTYPWPFAGYTLLKGKTAEQFLLTDVERDSCAVELGNFLSKLHNIPVDELKNIGAPNDKLGRVDVNIRLPKIMHYLDKIEALQLISVNNLKNFSLHFEKNTQPINFCLTHGDLYARHLILNSEKKLCGIIDWGDIHIGSPAVDLAIAHSFLPPYSHQKFKNAYGKIDAITWELAKFRAIYSSSLITFYGCEINDDYLIKEGIKGLSYINGSL